jgi:WD40 repeat protein/cell division protein FtsL
MSANSVFISYSRRNKDFAKRLFDALTERGYDPWVDFDDIPFSADWWQEIKEAIDQHDVIINVVSDHSLISRVCNAEISYARERNKRIIPLIVEKVDIKHVVGELYDVPYEADARDNWKYIRTLNWVYFYREQDDFDEGLSNIITAIEVDQVHLRYHTRLLTRALEWQEYGKQRGFLLRGEELSDAEEWLANSENKEPQPLDIHRQYVELSREEQEQDEEKIRRMQRQTTTLRRTAFGLVLTAIAVIGLILLSLQRANQQINANNATSTAVFENQQTVIAELDQQSEQANSLRLAVEAESEWSAGDPAQLALPLGLAAYGVIEDGEPPLRVQRIVAEAVYSPGVVRYFVAPEVAVGDACAAPTDSVTPHQSGLAHTREVSAVLYAAASHRVISGGLDRCVYIWDSLDGSLLTSIDTLGERVTTMALSPDGSSFAIGDSSGRVTLWSLGGELLKDLSEGGHTNRVTDVAFSYDGQYLLSGGLDSVGLIWDVVSGQVVRTLADHQSRVTAVAASPNGLTFMTGDTNGNLYLWQLDRNRDDQLDQLVTRTLVQDTAHTGAITTIELSDSDQAVTASLDGVVLSWDSLRTDATPEQINLPGVIQDFAFLSDRYGLFATEDGEVIIGDLLDVDAGLILELLYLRLPVQGSVLNTVSVGRAGDNVGAGFSDGTVLLVEVDNGAVEQQFDPHQFLVQNIVVQDGGTVVSREINEDIVLWEPGTQTATRLTLSDLEVQRPVITGDGESLIAYNPAGELIRLSLDTREPETYPADENSINSGTNIPTTIGTVFSGDGRFAMSVPFQGNAPSVLSQDEVLFSRPRILWEVETGAVRQRSIDIQALTGRSSFDFLTLNHDGSRFAVVTDDDTIQVFETTSLTLVDAFPRTRIVTAIAFGIDDDSLVVGYADGTVGLLDATTGEWRDLRGHDTSVFDVTVTRWEGRLLAATSGNERSILVWDVEAGELFRAFDNLASGTYRLEFDPGRGTLIAQFADQEATVWRLDTGDELIAWALENRFVPAISEGDCDAFQIPEPCGV